jgi:hypothetical protein
MRHLSDSLNSSALKWSKETGIELIHVVKNKFELDDLWKNWSKMPSNLKKESDKKCLELFGKTNIQLYKQLYNVVRYDGYPFILHQHNPRNGSEHYDLRFLDLKNPKLLHSFALPDNWQKNINKTVLFKTRDHDPRWLQLESYRLKTIDKGVINYKIYKPYGYFLLEFTGNIINGTYQLFKLRDKIRKDVWMLVKKS